MTFHTLGEAEESLPAVEPPPTRTDPLTVIIGGTNSGTVTSSPAGITCAGATVRCTGWFAEGTPVTLTATPDTGLVFVGWAGVCMGTGTCHITVNGPQSVVAHFASPLQYYHLDVLGSVRMITNAAGAVVKRHDYFAFGEDIEGPTGDPRRFTGKERDPATELHYFGARYYRNLWGRFTSVDPVMNLDDAVVDPQRWNRYSYVTNNPLKLIDPDGRNPFAILGGLGAAVFGTWQIVQNVVNDRPWHENVGVEASKGLLVGATLGLAAPAIVSSGTVTMTTTTTLTVVRLRPGANPAFDTALAGGRHAGALANYAGRSSKEIENAISGYRAVIADHMAKLGNPAAYVKDWAKLSPERQTAILNGWKDDIWRNQELLDVMIGLAASKR